MKNTIFIVLIMNFLVLNQLALAQDESPRLREEIKPVDITPSVKDGKQKEKSSESTPEDSNAKVPDLSNLSDAQDKSDVALPVRMVSSIPGFIFGTPFAVGRSVFRQTKAGTKDLVGESKNPVLVVPAAVFSLPFGIMASPFEGLGYSAVNSWKASGEAEPFSADAFSLGDWD